MSIADLRGLIVHLADQEVDHVIIGGIAVVWHGHIRATADLDIVPDPDESNLKRLLDALIPLDAKVLTTGEPLGFIGHSRLLSGGQNLSVRTSLGDLDVVQTLRGVPSFGDLSARASVGEAFGIRLRVASAADLIEMKRVRDSEQDRADIAALERGDP